MRRRSLMIVLLGSVAATFSGAWSQEESAHSPSCCPAGRSEEAAATITPEVWARMQAPREAPWAPYRLLEGLRALLPAALQASQSADSLTRQRGLFVLGALGLPEGISAAQQNLRHPERLVRQQAAVALTLLYREEGLPGAAVALREGPDWLRYYALLGLWRLNSPRAQQAIAASLPYLTGFVKKLAPRALQAPPRRRVNTMRSPKPERDMPLPALWETVCNEYVRESDLWWHQGDYEQCIRTQWTAIFFDPEYVDLYTNIAWLQWSMGRHGEAIRTYRQAIAANPSSWEAHHEFGLYYWRHGHKGLGVRYLQRAAELGSPPVPRRQLGHAYRELGELDKAKQVWEDILKMDPQDPIARRELERLAAKNILQ